MTAKNSLITLEESLLTGKDVRMDFDRNWLRIFDRIHADVPVEHKINFIHKAQLVGADPRKDQIYLTTYFSKKLGHKVGVPVFSYNFFINQANQTGDYMGVDVTTQVEEIFNPITGEMKKQLVSTAIAKRKGSFDVKFRAMWDEFYNRNNDIWNKIPYQMLEKCSIAGAIRRAFPEAMSGMFIAEEVSEVFYDEQEKWKVAEKEVESAKRDIEFKDDLSAKAMDSGRKGPIIEAITAACSDLTKGFNKDQKFKFMTEHLKVDSFGRLKALKVEELKELLETLEKMRSNPIVMPDEKQAGTFTTDDIPW